ncbi:MAG: type I DNA topoisomerase [Candidatus Eisenbacteria sp.]|nr:type I DNA topoisomerase [Candidatus Eisenbacteria bacterium]
MGKSLVIVESPAKAKTIAKYLGKGFEVKASMGHVRDLPLRKLGVDLENNFEPSYVTIRGQGKTLKALRTASAKADEIFLAPDPDREGEAIAWHLAQVLGSRSEKIRRVLFNEITKNVIREAFANAVEVDKRKVDAQQARRVMDRLVGYKVSPLLWKVIRRGISAGRVQSVALRLVCEREEEIEGFVPVEYWTIEVDVQVPTGELVRAKVWTRDGEKLEIHSEAEAKEIVRELKSVSLVLGEVTRKERKRRPKAPFITSTLQQAASRRLGMSARQTMSVAQELYEGLEIGQGELVGLITYMRTDSTRVSAEASQEARQYITGRFGSDYAYSRPPLYKSRKKVQDAHEAIRPTSVNRAPEDLKGFLSLRQHKLYKLIWEKFLASQMQPARSEIITFNIEGGRYGLRASNSKLMFPGFLAVYKEDMDEEEDGQGLPGTQAGESLVLKDTLPEQHFTEPPPHYSEATLIQELETKGIGRPSTYASIIWTILHRRYVSKEKTALVPTDLGKTVWDLLGDWFPDVFNVAFTAKMESELDRIESGEDDWVNVVRQFYDPFSKDLETLSSKTAELKKSLQTETDENCPECGKSLVVKWGRGGQFIACSGFPECRYSRSLPGEEPQLEPTDEVCDQCNAPMVIRRGRFGRFLACSRYPECKNTRAVSLGVSCPEEGCKGDLVERRTRRGRVFYGCSNYPNCKFASWHRPVKQTCPECGKGLMVEKQTKAKGPHLNCLSCGAEIPLPDDDG